MEERRGRMCQRGVRSMEGAKKVVSCERVSKGGRGYGNGAKMVWGTDGFRQFGVRGGGKMLHCRTYGHVPIIP